MAFETETSRVPTSIGRIRITLIDHDGLEANHLVRYDVAIFDQIDPEESMADKRGDLIPHLTSTEKQQLVTLMAAIRTKAEDEFLP